MISEYLKELVDDIPCIHWMENSEESRIDLCNLFNHRYEIAQRMIDKGFLPEDIGDVFTIIFGVLKGGL